MFLREVVLSTDDKEKFMKEALIEAKKSRINGRSSNWCRRGIRW